MKLKSAKNSNGEPWSAANLIGMLAKKGSTLQEKLEANPQLETVMTRTMREFMGFMSAEDACNAMLRLVGMISMTDAETEGRSRDEELATFLSFTINYLLTAPGYNYVISHFSNAYDLGRYSARAVILYRITTPEVISSLRRSAYGSVFSAEFSRGAELFGQVA